MKAVCLHDKSEIEAFLRRNTYLHLYEIGDLDDFFWGRTTWYAFRDVNRVEQLALLYTATSLPVLIGLTQEYALSMRELLHSISDFLPKRFYACLSLGLAQVFADDYQIEEHGIHQKMALADGSRAEGVDTSEVSQLSTADLDDLEGLYRLSYPRNWFDPRVLETGCYYGIRQSGELVSAAGVHVYSPHYRVAALGNIATHPDWRGHGLGTRVTAKVCQVLQRQIDHIGLNVKADNASAIACYKKLGFERIASYEECSFELRR